MNRICVFKNLCTNNEPFHKDKETVEINSSNPYLNNDIKLLYDLKKIAYIDEKNYTHSLVCFAFPNSISFAERTKVSVSGFSPDASKFSVYFTI